MNKKPMRTKGCPPRSLTCVGEDVYIDGNECNVKVDVVVDQKKPLLIWGTVVNGCHCPVAGVLVTLYKYVGRCKQELKELCCTYTDCKGCYRFQLEDADPGRYRVMVGDCDSHHKRACSCESCREPSCAPSCYTSCGNEGSYSPPASYTTSSTQNCVRYC